MLSPVGFAVLSGAGLFKGAGQEEVHVHMTSTAQVSEAGEIDLTDALETEEKIDTAAPIFAIKMDKYGDMEGTVIEGLTVDETGKKLTGGTAAKGEAVFVDYYVTKKSANVSELQIDAGNFAGSYYVEASTLFREQSTGMDRPAEITLPNVKIQSNFTFTMASTGDPSTFTFTMDAFPGYTLFDRTKKVLCVMQVVEDVEAKNTASKSVMEHENGEVIDEAQTDSTGA